MTLPRFCAVLSGIAFLVYATLCFFSASMASDFHRFGLDTLRLPTGILELLGGAGLLIGLKWPPALSISSAGLALLMFFAFAIRVRMRDSVALSTPSFLCMLLNLYILLKSPKPHFSSTPART